LSEMQNHFSYEGKAGRRTCMVEVGYGASEMGVGDGARYNFGDRLWGIGRVRQEGVVEEKVRRHEKN
jgi:hypothetical protein